MQLFAQFLSPARAKDLFVEKKNVNQYGVRCQHVFHIHELKNAEVPIVYACSLAETDCVLSFQSEVCILMCFCKSWEKNHTLVW